MKLAALVVAFTAALAGARPVAERIDDSTVVIREVEARQDDANTTRTDLEDGSASNCPEAILIWARGSTEPGNMVRRFPLSIIPCCDLRLQCL